MDITHPLLELKSDCIQKLCKNAVDYAVSNGIQMEMRCDTLNQRQFIHAPFTLFPSYFPKSEFDFVVSIQPHINMLMHRLSQDYNFICDSLQSVAEVDSFTKKQLDVYKESFFISGLEPTLGILRSDYMVNNVCNSEAKYKIKQIEVNCMAASFMGIGTHKMQQLYSTVLRSSSAGMNSMIKKVPINNALMNIAKGLVKAWENYGSNTDAVVMFFVSSFDNNICDQRQLEYGVYSINPSVKIQRQSFTDMNIEQCCA